MKTSLVAAFLAFAISGCASMNANKGGMATIYADVKDSVMATGTTGTKVGKACQKNYLGAVVMGDATVEAAKKAGGIKTVASIDAQYDHILGIVGNYCTIVTGM